MKRTLGGILLMVLTCGSANAALISRLSGQAYYDDVLNVTWVTDANLSRTSGYDADGLMTWSDAQAWIASLNAASGHLGVTDWRLPSASLNGYATPIDCSTATELACRDNELGYMFYHNLVSYPSSPGPFTNLQHSYWSGTETVIDTSLAWRFDFLTGGQLGQGKTFTLYAWALRPGDIGAVPVPAVAWLIAPAFGMLAPWVKRRHLVA